MIRPQGVDKVRKGWSKTTLLAVICIMILSLQACLRPVEGDFPNRGQGLADDELLWVLRIPISKEEADLTTVSMRDSISFSNYNQPFFANGIQQLVKGILNGEIKAYDEYPGQTELKNARERLIQMGGTGQNIDPLLRVAELYVVVNIAQGYYNGRPEFLRLIWRDPSGREADRGFAGIRLDNEASGQFLLGSNFLSEFAKIKNYYAMPIYLRTNFREYAIRSIEEARFVQSMVYAGKWNEIGWEDEGINISGEHRVTLSPETVIPLAGFYRFNIKTEGDSNTFAELYLTAENDYLVADWSNRFRIEKILPYGPMQFFSTSGELYWFELRPDSNLALFVIQGKDTLGSYQNPVY
jgi:hypothetical protein